MDQEDFRKLLTYDLVQLGLSAEGNVETKLNDLACVLLPAIAVPAESGNATAFIKGFFANNGAAARTVTCRIEAPAAGDIPTIRATIRSITESTGGFNDAGRRLIRLDDGAPVTISLSPEQVFAKRPESELPTLRDDGQELSKLAIRYPATFLELHCDWEWLPGTAGAGFFSVRDRLNSTDPGEKITEDAMLALLEFRMLTTQRLRECIEPLALAYSRDRRRQFALDKLPEDKKTRVDLAPEVEVFAQAAKKFGGNIPGSTELSSDIDINTFGDGTEFVVRQFNALFRARFAGREPGSVFDVNVYAKDFLPFFGNKSFWERAVDGKGKAPEKRIRPQFDHEFQTPDTEKKDALEQLTHGLTKLRRYMVDLASSGASSENQEREWITFRAAFSAPVMSAGDRALLLDHLKQASTQHLQWNHWVLTTFRARATSSIPEFTSDVDLLRSELELNGKGRTEVMSAQNALYEHVLKNEVEPARMGFDLLKMTLKVDRLDAAYGQLRDAMSKSLYFANEAYVTCGGVLHVVGGKQQKSRKVSDDYAQKRSFHNIAYSVHELIQSAVDQLADIHKEARRDFARPRTALGDVLLATGKYIHRLLNALKHMYLILERVNPAGQERPFSLWPRGPAPPGSEASQAKWWYELTNFAYGLEALKKTNLNSARDTINALIGSDGDAAFKSIADPLKEGAAFILVKKFMLTRAQLGTLFTSALTEAFTPTQQKEKKIQIAEYVAGTKVVTVLGATQVDVRIDSAAGYYTFFNSLVQHALVDYLNYLRLNYHDIPKLRSSGLRPNCPVDSRIEGNKLLEESAPVALLSSKQQYAFLYEEDEDIGEEQ